MRNPFLLSISFALLLQLPLSAQENGDRLFRQLDDELPTPTATRTGSGAPGHAYWQQRADYVIEAALDEEKHRITGKETITYTNHSPDTLRYLWVQLDQNYYAKDAEALRMRTTSATGKSPEIPYSDLGFELMRQTFDGGCDIASVTDINGRNLPHTIAGTMMRVDLAAPLPPGKKVRFAIAWSYAIRNISFYSHRTGYELIRDDPHPLYTIAHWYPRMAAYTDRYGWHVHNYLGQEFALEFGDFSVRLTVPADHVVAATGELQNGNEVLTAEQRERLERSKTAKAPVFIITPDEARAKEAKRAEGARTWHFEASNVRDFAWASSRKYIWDSQGVRIGGRTVMAMSYYPREGEPLWSRYSTQAVHQTLEVYSKHATDYPYPVALSVNGGVGGMEHPMISFQRERPEPDGTYSHDQKYGLISVIIHEVGHNWFPMIINNDERRWRWMDEGLNSFVQQLAEARWEKDYPSDNDFWRSDTLDYMSSDSDQPIMTTAGLIIEGGVNAYSKPTLALTVLRESILGREVFDFAFREYCRRWRFKRPMPADFFRTMEDASGRDLDWFFRGWFFGTDHVDLAITGIRRLELQTQNPEVDKPRAKARKEAEIRRPRQLRNDRLAKRLDTHPELGDFYNNEWDEFAVTKQDREAYAELLASLKPHEQELLKTDQNIYVVDFRNVGGLVMPLVLAIEYADGSEGELRIPATVWRRSIGGRVSKMILSRKKINRITLDPKDEMADVDRSNNVFPQRIESGTLRLKKEPEEKNPMQLRREEKD